jgi:NADH:ubiquinone oxidoreductase subunit C
MSEQEKKAQGGEKKEPLMDIKEIEKDTLLDEVTRISFDNWRLIQICATKVGEEKYEILYTFGKGYQWKNLRIHLSKGESVSSITSIYEVAYLYENEIPISTASASTCSTTTSAASSSAPASSIRLPSICWELRV